MANHTINSLIQGISQQEASSRGTASAEDQVNCLNEVLDGVVSRMGSIVRGLVALELDDPFVHMIRRSNDEKYLLVREGEDLNIYNMVTGELASITGDLGDYADYTGSARKAHQAVTVGDTTFFLNRQVVPTMGATLSDARPNKAVAYFRAGGYSQTYTLTLKSGATTVTGSFTSHDNASAGDELYIQTTYLANQMLGILNSTMIPALTTAGKTGFSVVLLGSTLVIYGGANTFDISTSDGSGDTQLISFKNNVRTIANLPQRCVDGYQVSVSDNGAEESSKYYLKYVGEEATGRWVEVVAPATPTNIDPETMPQVITCTGLNTFTIGPGSWGARLAGDGILTAKDPSFIGSPIHTIQFIGQRLSLSTEFENTISRSRNAFVFFPDTVQTDLATAPVDYDVSNGSSTSMSHAIVAGGRLQFWGDKQQTYLDSGQDPIREDTTEILPLANYEFDGETSPTPIGMGSLLFGTSIGSWGKVTEVYFNNGKPQGEIDISSHVPKLLRGNMRHLAPGEGTKKSLVLTDDEDGWLYLYQWYNQGNDRVQSAWSKWFFGAPYRILWAGVDGSTAWLLVRWPSGCTIEYLIMDRFGDEDLEQFPLRLDHRMSEADAEFDEDHFVLELPYDVPEGDRRSGFRVVERTTVAEDVSQRGRSREFTWLTDSSISIPSDNEDLEFYFGSIPLARRRFSDFWARDREEQPIIHDRLHLKNISIGHVDTVEYSVVVTFQSEVREPQTYRARVLGDPSLLNNEVAVRSGSFKADIGEESENVSIELVNDTYFPCVWKSAKYVYDLTVREGQ